MKQKRPQACVYSEKGPCEDTAERWSFASQEIKLWKTLALLALWSWTFSLQSCEEIYWCCLGFPVCGILLWHPWQANGLLLGGSVGKNPLADAGEAGSIPGSGRSPGEGNGNPLQYSCLANPRDREAWRAIDLEVTTYQLKNSNKANRYVFPGGGIVSFGTSGAKV